MRNDKNVNALSPIYFDTQPLLVVAISPNVTRTLPDVWNKCALLLYGDACPQWMSQRHIKGTQWHPKWEYGGQIDTMGREVHRNASDAYWTRRRGSLGSREVAKSGGVVGGIL